MTTLNPAQRLLKVLLDLPDWFVNLDDLSRPGVWLSNESPDMLRALDKLQDAREQQKNQLRLLSDKHEIPNVLGNLSGDKGSTSTSKTIGLVLTEPYEGPALDPVGSKGGILFYLPNLKSEEGLALARDMQTMNERFEMPDSQALPGLSTAMTVDARGEVHVPQLTPLFPVNACLASMEFMPEDPSTVGVDESYWTFVCKEDIRWALHHAEDIEWNRHNANVRAHRASKRVRRAGRNR